jgi:hypothetical protein
MHRTGSYTLDILLGGGYKPGHTYTFQGSEGAGKTALVLSSIAELQDVYLPLLISTEPLDLRWAESLGVNLEEMIHTTNPYIEDLEGIILRLQKPSVIVVDSLSMLTSHNEDVSLHTGMEDVSACIQYMFDTLWLHLRLYPSIVLLTCQLRGNDWTEGVTGEPKVTKNTHYRFHLQRSVGGVRVEAIQHADYPPGQFGTIPITEHGINSRLELFALALSLGIVQARGSWYYIQNQRLGHGVEEASTSLQDHREQVEYLLLGEPL